MVVHLLREAAEAYKAVEQAAEQAAAQAVAVAEAAPGSATTTTNNNTSSSSVALDLDLNATYLETTATAISDSLDLLLWNTDDPTDPTGDHYVTQVASVSESSAGGPITRTGVRDFIDYDSNLMAVAFGIAPHNKTTKTKTETETKTTTTTTAPSGLTRAEKVLARVDSGVCECVCV
jgi:hypothetical protein